MRLDFESHDWTYTHKPAASHPSVAHLAIRVVAELDLPSSSRFVFNLT